MALTADKSSCERGHETRSLWLELTGHCNWNCLFCYNPWRPGPVRDYPRGASLNELVSAISRLLERATFDYVALSGGEPLLYRPLDDLVAWLQRQSVYTVLTTNGELLSASRASSLRKLGLRGVQVSIMSVDEAVHNRLAGRDSWRGAVAGLLVATKHKFDVSAVFTANRENIATLVKTVRFLAELSVSRVLVNRLQIGGSAASNVNSLFLSQAEYLERLEEAISEAAHAGVELLPVPPIFRTEPDPRRPWGRLTVGPGGVLKICNLSNAHVGRLSELSGLILDQVIADLDAGRVEGFRSSVDNCSCYDYRLAALRRGRE